MYRSRFKLEESQLLLELNTAQVCRRLNDANTNSNSDNAETLGLRNDLHLTSSLTLHLIQAWNLLAQRNFERQQVDGELEVTVGLTNIHFHLAGKTDFTHFLNRTHGGTGGAQAGTIFQKRGVQLKKVDPRKKDDPWGDTFDISGTPLAGKQVSTGNIEYAIRKQEAETLQPDNHPTFMVPLIDSSPGGYCIEWQDSIPAQVKAGELLGLREPTRNRWSLGVVRWVNQSKGATQLGIQILSAQATPIGLAVIHKTGSSSEYLRALELPALKAINQPATLITNAISFREYSKARIYHNVENAGQNDDQHVQLTRRIFATGAFSQFIFRELVSGKPKETAKSDDFDSVWDS
jgi:hypothetical protein